MPIRFILLFTGLVLIAGPAAAADLAGTIVRLRGDAVASLAGQVRTLTTGDDLFVGETVSTGQPARLRLRLLEGAVITLGNNSTFTMQGYEDDEEVFDLVEGVFLAVSDHAAGPRDHRLRVQTPIGNMGVRGTSFWGRYDGKVLSVAMLEGTGIWVEAAGVHVEMTEPGTGLKVTPGAPPTQPKPWKAERIENAKRMVAFE